MSPGMDIGKDLQTAYDDGYEAGRQDTNRWISVKDKLPEENGEYLVCTQPWDSTWRIDILGYDARSKRFGKIDLDYMYDNDGWFEIDYVTHWQKLPELPKEENDNGTVGNDRR